MVDLPTSNSAEDYDSELLNASRANLASKITRWTREEPNYNTQISSLGLRRYDALTEPTSYLHEPSICLVVQGAKRVMLADEAYVYNPTNYLITSVGVPVMAHVTEASNEEPFLGLILKLDLKAVAQIMVDGNLPLGKKKASTRGMAVNRVSVPLLNAFDRLLDLLDDPDSIPILAPLIEREIIYRLLMGEQGAQLRQIAATGHQSHQIARAIDWLKENFRKPLRIENLASHAGMSTSTFHHHFRALTAMSPLQYQKSLRLHEARQLMFLEKLDAATAAFEVGYENPSQFSREYSRQFGAPPLRDVNKLRKLASVEMSS